MKTFILFPSEKAPVVDDAMAEAKSSQPAIFPELPEVLKGRDTTTQAALEEKEGRDLLNKQPLDILKTIGGFFAGKEENSDSKALAGLARTNPRLNKLFQPAAQAAVDKILFNHIVRGEPKEVYAMLDKQPSLLLHTFTVTDPAGYKLKDRTPLQAALCCQDPQMAEEIQNRLIDYAGVEEADRQRNMQFPAGWKKDEADRWAPVFTQLEKLDAAVRAAEEKDISADENYKLTVREESAVERELKEFQRLLCATRNKPIETGRTFNPDLMQRIANRYDRCCNDFGYDDPKSLLFWQRVFGYAQGFLSAPDAQAFVAGLSTTTSNLENKKPQGRNLKIKLWDLESGNWRDVAFYSAEGLGVDYAGLGGAAWGGVAGTLQNFYQSKTDSFQKLIPRHPDSSPVRHKAYSCSVM